MSSRWVMLLFTVVHLGCGAHGGHFEVISAHGFPSQYSVLARNVNGKACRVIPRGPLLQWAVDDALGKVPQADLLASTKISIRRGLFGIWTCYLVQGAAIRVTR
jgi:hypothetical protein